MGISCSIMNEHRDAYYHWHSMIDRGYIPKKGNYLLHVDHHDDMVAGGYAWDLLNMPENAEEALAFTDQCLGIADFIVPALWEGIFSTLHIVKNLWPVNVKTAEMVVNRINGSALVYKAYIPFVHAGMLNKENSNIVRYTKKENGLNGHEDLEGAENIVLDVDLDYFCWDDSLKSVPEKKIEITREAYDEYLADRSHPFRIFPKKILSAKEVDGRCYLVYSENIDRDALPDEELIEKRINRLFKWLSACEIEPCAIDICRSTSSGYMPAERAAFTEKCFMEKLHDTYSIDLVRYL